MFSGAIGRAYHQLYEPIMAPKDEINLILKSKTRNHCKDLESENDLLKQKVQELEKQLKKCKQSH
jgi:dCMP deaminase